VVEIVFHDVPPLGASCRHLEGSVEQANPLPGPCCDDKDAIAQERPRRSTHKLCMRYEKGAP
jgi:hypothetical protein